MNPELFAYVSENLAGVVVGIVGLILGGLQGVILRWLKMARTEQQHVQQERHLAYRAHQLVDRHGALLVDAAQLVMTSHGRILIVGPELLQQVQEIARQQDSLRQQLTFLLERGPREINGQLANIQKEIRQMQIQLESLVH